MGLAADSGRAAPGRAERLSPSLPFDDRIDPEDADALVRIAGGDTGALHTAFVRHWEAVARAALRIAGDVDDARDAAQEAFIRLHARPPSADTPLRAWLCRVATNEAVNALRSGRRRVAREVRHLASADAAATDDIAGATLLQNESSYAKHSLRCPRVLGNFSCYVRRATAISRLRR